MIAAAITAAIYLLRLDAVAGMCVDDAWYALFGQAIAQGQGYSMVNSPIPGLLPPGPPGFPVLLALVTRLSRLNFPYDLLRLKAVSIAAMAGVGVLGYCYFVQRGLTRAKALLLAFAVVTTPAFVFLATSTLMSECVFSVALLATLVVVRSETTARTFVAALLAAATVTIRTAGLALPLAVVACLVSGRQFRRAQVFAATVCLALFPWFLYEHVHRAPLARRIEAGGAHAFTYPEQFWMRFAGDRTLGTVTALEVPGRMVTNAFDVFGRDVGAIVVPALYRGAEESGQEVFAVGGLALPASMGSGRGTMVVSLVLSTLGLIGFVSAFRRGATPAEYFLPLSLLVTVLFPMWSYRFVLPLAPLLYFYVTRGLEAMSGRHVESAARVVLLVVIGLNLLDHGEYILKLYRGEPIEWIADAREVDSVVDWIARELPPDARIATTNPALVYLRTRRQTVASNDVNGSWDRWKRQRIQYVVCLVVSPLPAGEHQYRVLFRSPHRGYWVIQMS